MKLDRDIEIQPLIQRSQRLLKLSKILAKVVIDTESEEEASEPDSHRISYIFESIEKFGNTSAFCMVFSPKGKEGKITTHLLDPGVLSGEIFAISTGLLSPAKGDLYEVFVVSRLGSDNMSAYICGG